ncbi:aminotransferase class IV [Candidatus Persebacteraceae bacterium Df01]|jgi:D-alanine transaminase|uniref:Aminotransferase class IV n=1 Tax=Candidatus Doriopsillibacter californiensis TaxID=2970740 RepID=A0ABT7QJR7_9GAMM|nr:aminotransferase class IV [Candidatus Persebacteraceae bacterium Df01]
MTLCYLNGEIEHLKDARVSVLDRGFLFGDGVYEVVPVYAGKPFYWERHMERLARSLKKTGIEAKTELLEQSVQELISRADSDYLALYIQITRGAAATRKHFFPRPAPSPTVFMMATPLAPVAAEKIQNGVCCRSEKDFRWQRGDIKSISLLGAVLVSEEATAGGYEETIFVRDGVVTEAAACNIIVVQDKNHVVTPVADERILRGITRDVVLEIARSLDIEVVERDVTRAELAVAPEVWITSSTREVLPVTELDGVAIGSGKPGAVFQKVYAALRRHIENGGF